MIPLFGALYHKGYDAEHHSHDKHRMKADDTPQHEFSFGKPLTPPAVVGIAYHEARQDEEKVDGQIAVVESLIDRRCGESLEEVIPYHHKGRDSAQAVEKFVVGL